MSRADQSLTRQTPKTCSAPRRAATGAPSSVGAADDEADLGLDVEPPDRPEPIGPSARAALPARPDDVGARDDDRAGPPVVADRQVLPVRRQRRRRPGRNSRPDVGGVLLGGVEVDVVGDRRTAGTGRRPASGRRYGSTRRRPTRTTAHRAARRHDAPPAASSGFRTGRVAPAPRGPAAAGAARAARSSTSSPMRTTSRLPAVDDAPRRRAGCAARTGAPVSPGIRRITDRVDRPVGAASGPGPGVARRRRWPAPPSPSRSGRKVSTMTASSSKNSTPMRALVGARLRAVRVAAGVQRHRALPDARALARLVVAAAVEHHLVGVDVRVVVRHRDRQRVVVDLARHEVADDEVARPRTPGAPAAAGAPGR